jgi:starch phosphorylase
MTELGLDLDDLLELEEEPGLGNGGLGRLAACFMESLATLQYPAIGYGVRYEFGIFDQDIRDGWQIEKTDTWLHNGNPWEIRRPGICFDVRLGGRTETVQGADGSYRVRWMPDRVIKGYAYDTPIVGYSVPNANLLRLWKAEATDYFDFQAFNVGDYYRAVEEKVAAETLTKVLYPNDASYAGKQLRLSQQYFFVSCSLQDMIRIYLQRPTNRIQDFHRQFVVQLNDTHPAIGIAELMRLLVDDHALPWDQAWEVTRNTFAYTNHTLLPEALEKWPLDLFKNLLPRHLEIIYEINHRFLQTVRERYPGDDARLSRLSLIDESGPRYVRMANLATVGSRAVNGVAELHSDLLKSTVLRDFYELWPEKFSNKTNGVTPRRFVMLSNPKLTDLITRAIGPGWKKNLDEWRRLEPLATDVAFQEDWRLVKRSMKDALARFVALRTGVSINPDSLFDIQVKRIHEYKRQHLNALHVVSLYQHLLDHPDADLPARTFIFGGKAAPGYYLARLIIKFINAIADVVNQESRLRDRLKVVFIPDFNVKVAQRIYPAAELSEQISTAGKEASGTGNMKFAMNGALTIGTLDGANIEIRDAVGAENFFLFGLNAAEVEATHTQGYHPWDYYNNQESLRRAIDLINSGHFSQGDPNLFRPLTDSLLHHDEYRVLADFAPYAECQQLVGRTYQDPKRWWAMSILNVARMSGFSSDRTIRDYSRDIWHSKPLDIDLGKEETGPFA